MSTYTEDGDYWHDRWEEAQAQIAALKVERDEALDADGKHIAQVNQQWLELQKLREVILDAQYHHRQHHFTDGTEYHEGQEPSE